VYVASATEDPSTGVLEQMCCTPGVCRRLHGLWIYDRSGRLHEEIGSMDAVPFGIDFGGSGIKGAPVGLDIGEFIGERVRIKTPQPSTPEAVAEVLVQLLGEFPECTGPVGVTVPAVVRHGVASSAANIDRAWIGTDADAVFTEATGRDVHIVNDADAAGLAEVRYGAASGRGGLVILTTLGTGIGSAMVYDGVLMPNSELGHLEIDGKDAEKSAANSVREKHDLSWSKWANRLTTYYRTLEKLFSPDLIVLGGGVSKHAEKFVHLIAVETEIVPAKLQNRAGIVGAALWAAEAGDECAEPQLEGAAVAATSRKSWSVYVASSTEAEDPSTGVLV
jgi:polyphosphate glucokinase